MNYVMDISRKEILRYLGYRGKPADEIVTNSIESCLAELLRIISPKCIYQIFPVTFGENHMVTIGSISIQSKICLSILTAAKKQPFLLLHLAHKQTC